MTDKPYKDEPYLDEEICLIFASCMNALKRFDQELGLGTDMGPLSVEGVSVHASSIEPKIVLTYGGEPWVEIGYFNTDMEPSVRWVEKLSDE